MVRGSADAARSQVGDQRFGVLAGRGVDDAGLLGRAHGIDDGRVLLALQAEGRDRQEDVRTIEAVHEHARIAHAEMLHDVVAPRAATRSP